MPMCFGVTSRFVAVLLQELEASGLRNHGKRRTLCFSINLQNTSDLRSNEEANRLYVPTHLLTTFVRVTALEYSAGTSIFIMDTGGYWE